MGRRKKKPKHVVPDPLPVWIQILNEKREERYPKSRFGQTSLTNTAVDLGISVSTFYAWTHCRRLPGVSNLRKLSEFMGVSIDRLVYLLSEGKPLIPGRPSPSPPVPPARAALGGEGSGAG